MYFMVGGIIDFSALSFYLLWSIIGSETRFILQQTSVKKNVFLRSAYFLMWVFWGFFKYFNFFIDSFSSALGFIGKDAPELWTLNIILPVGISFYTFQTMSYSLDIYKGKMKPTRDLITFATFVGFFPQLVAGPIERASNLLPQLLQKRKFNYVQAVEGLQLILWGLFKKVVIADSLAPMVDDIFANSHSYSSSTLLLGAVLFGFQIYGDFSGYSDMAIGTAKLLGIELMSNFKFPYFSRNIAEFWRRWHISLSTWFRDYVYIPLGGSRTTRPKAIRNVLIVFLISGFWHGANWTFIIWGLFHALLFIPIFLGGTHRKYLNSISIRFNFGILSEVTKVITTFTLVNLGWVLFRSESISAALRFYKRLFTDFSLSVYHHPMNYRLSDYFILLVLFVFYEYLIRKNERNPFYFNNKFLRFCLYVIITLALLLFYDDRVDRSFIYFQF